MNMLMAEKKKKRTQGKTDTARRLKCMLLLPREMLMHTGDGNKLLYDLEMLEKEAMTSGALCRATYNREFIGMYI